MATPLKITISNEHPHFILMAPSAPNAHWAPSESYDPDAEALVAAWESLDNVLKEHTSLQIEGICDDDWRRNDVLLPYAEKAGVPITVQVQTNNADINDTVPLDRVKSYLDSYSCIVGVQIGEASLRTFVGSGADAEHRMGRNARYARDLILLAAEHGCFMAWKLMTENYAALGTSADNEALFDAISEHADYVIPMHEMNHEFAKWIDHLACMGLWLSDTTSQWGVQPQSWYWSDAGYREPGCFMPGSLEMPGAMYSIMMMLGATAGAAAYGMEPPWDIWTEPGAYRFRDHVAPLLRRLVTERLIPTKDDVLNTMPVAYHMHACRRHDEFHEISRDVDFDHHEGRLVRATCGVYDRPRDSEIIPNDPRFGWIPLLPAKTRDEVLARFDRVIRPGEIESIEHARSIAGECFPPVDRGEAWSALAGPLAFAANTHENWFVPERVKLEVPRVPTDVELAAAGDLRMLRWTGLAGDRGYHVWQKRDGAEERLTDAPTPDTMYELDDARDGDWFAVSAITDEMETVEGTLHLHDFLVLDRRESRRSPWVNAAGETADSARYGEALPEDDPEVTAKERRSAACTPVEDLASPEPEPDDPHADIKREVMVAMAGFKGSVEAEDADALAAWYAPEYAEEDDRTVESVRVAFKSLCQKYLAETLAGARKSRGTFTAWQLPAMRLFVREWAEVAPERVVVKTVYEFWMGGGPEMEPSDMFKHPLGSENKDFEMTWVKRPEGWRIAATTPSFLRAEDITRFRNRYPGW